MKNHRIRIGILLCVSAVALLMIYLNNKVKVNEGPSDSDLSHDNVQPQASNHGILKVTNPMDQVIVAYRTPIEFYGKVVDQHGNPVAMATVRILPFDKPFGESDSKIMLTSGVDGRFSTKGIKGLAIGVEVEKQGYLVIPDLGFEKPASSRRIEYGLDGGGGARFKDRGNPTVFTLYKVEQFDPLVYIPEKRWRLPTDGKPRSIALDTIEGFGSHQIEYRLDTDWAKIPKNSDTLFGTFDWSFEMRIPGGGFVRSKSDYAFEAPELGYEERIRFDHPKDGSDWKQKDYGRYFVKFSDGTYGRIRFGIHGSSDSETGPLSMTSWMNTKPRSRNLASEKKDSTVMPDE